MNTLLVQGNAGIIPLPSQSVHCVVLSPPYWALRSYAGAQEVRWPAVKYTPLVGLDPVHIKEEETKSS